MKSMQALHQLNSLRTQIRKAGVVILRGGTRANNRSVGSLLCKDGVSR